MKITNWGGIPHPCRGIYIILTNGCKSHVMIAQPSPPNPLSHKGRGGAERILMKNLPSPLVGEGQGEREPRWILQQPLPVLAGAIMSR